MTRPLRLAIAQLPLEMGSKDRNLQVLQWAVEIAHERRADLVLLPECLMAGWMSTETFLAAEKIPGPTTRLLGRLAARLKIGLVAGLEEKEGRKIYNSAVAIDRRGRLIGRYRKRAELPLARKVYGIGSENCLFQFEGWRIGLNICADNWTPALATELYRAGARLILSPSAWAVEPGGEEKNLEWIAQRYQKVLKKNPLYLAAANSVGAVTQGPWTGRVFQGESLVFSPRGDRILHAPRQEPGVFLVTLYPDQVS